MNKLKHTLIIAVCVALASQFHINFYVQGFIITLSVIVFAVFLYHYTELNPIVPAIAAGIVSPLFRGFYEYLKLLNIKVTVHMVWPDVTFYFSYGIFFYFLFYRKENKNLTRFLFSVFMCDFLSNIVEMSARTRVMGLDGKIVRGLLAIALVRTLIVAMVIVAMKYYKSFLIKEEHEDRYRRLILLTSGFKSEIYFMKKNMAEIEDVMRKSYTVYKSLSEGACTEELKDLALDIAKDVHEIKKDYIKVIKGLEEMAAEETGTGLMRASDIVRILELDTREYIQKNRLDIKLDFKLMADFSVLEHFYLMSILRNLINNSIEAMEEMRNGLLRFGLFEQGENYIFKISDNGPGIKESNIGFIFNPGFSTKFDKSTGSIGRGIGLTLVRDLVQNKFCGEISVNSIENTRTIFIIRIPKSVFGEGSYEILHS